MPRVLFTRSMRRLFAFALSVGLAAGGLAGCHQGVGERCQTNADCDDGLICNSATSTCLATSTGGGIDGGVDAPLDAGIDADVDALAIDAPLDAAIDAP